MSQSDDDKILNNLYQQGHHDEPPTEIDELIMQHAKQSHQSSQNRKNWRPWLAAASVVLVMPVIWLLVQNEQLMEQATPVPTIEADKPKPAKMARKEAKPQVAEEIMMAPTQSERQTYDPAAPVAGMAADSLDVQDLEEEDKFTETDSLSKREDVETESVKANRAMLMNEFKAKKKTLKQSNLDPILALELQQFEQYLEQGELEQATQLLQEMQEREPDFDFSELAQRLSDAGSD